MALETRISICVPFNMDLSKNRLWKTTRTGRMYKDPKAKAAQELVWYKLRERLGKQGAVFLPTKTWVEIYVERPNRRQDPINFVDSICDAVKEAIKVDDSWFALSRVDWEFTDDAEPKVFLSVSQRPDGHEPAAILYDSAVRAALRT